MQVLGTPVQAIMDTEDRELFVKKLDEIDVKTIKSEAVENMADAVQLLHGWAIPSSYGPHTLWEVWAADSATTR